MKPPTTMFHYCDGDVFQKIIDGRCVWASDYRGMNDAAERELGLELLKELRGDPEQALQRELISNVIHDLEADKHHMAAASCFSEDEDSLSQWWAYGGDGTGFAIGIPIKRIERFIILDPNTNDKKFTSDKVESYVPGLNWGYCEELEFRQVEYNRESAMEKLKEVLLRVRGKDETTAASLRKIKGEIAAICLSVKNKQFSIEKEWRLVFLGSVMPFRNSSWEDSPFKFIDFRHSKRGMIPYISIPISEHAEFTIVLGPRNLSHEAAVEAFVMKRGFPKPEVKRSKATYRG